MRRGIWTISISSRAQGVDSVLAVERPLMSGACRRNPQHFCVCTQVRGFSAQVIHSLCTEKPVSKSPAGRAGSSVRSAGAGMTRSMLNARIWPGSGGDRPRRRGPDVRRPRVEARRSTNARLCLGRPRSTARRGQQEQRHARRRSPAGRGGSRSPLRPCGASCVHRDGRQSSYPGEPWPNSGNRMAAADCRWRPLL